MESKREFIDSAKMVEIEDKNKVDEVLRGYRILFIDKDNFLYKKYGLESIRIYDKNLLKISKYGDDEFVKERNRLLRDKDFVTYKEQMNVLKERGIWSDEHENRIEILRKKADELIKEKDKLISKMENNKGKSNKSLSQKVESIKEDIIETHNELLDLLSFQINFFGDTIEMRSQIRQQMGWMVSSICKDGDYDGYDPNMRIFKDIDDIENSLNKKEFISLLNECNSFWEFMEGKNEPFFAESPEELISGSDGDHPKS